MDELNWYYPEKIQEVPDFLKEGCIPHGGGTYLLKSGLLRREAKSVRGIIDISGIKELKDFKEINGRIELGAGLTYGETIVHVGRLLPGSIIVKALSGAASNALRNRITLGGSIASFPPWSDLAGPLVALDADVYFITKDSAAIEMISTEGFLRMPADQKRVFITKVAFKSIPYRSWYYRDVRTRFDYPKFTISITVSGVGGSFEPVVRIVITGTKGKYLRESAIEESIVEILRRKKNNGEKLFSGSLLKGLIDTKLTARFQRKMETSGEYLQHAVSVELRRGLEEVMRSKM
ncbi:MAG: hypothetical protein GXP33_06290 [Spirochaetes bacterium]|nr:hypothetical protein [Spirochaetota bacterium]